MEGWKGETVGGRRMRVILTRKKIRMGGGSEGGCPSSCQRVLNTDIFNNILLSFFCLPNITFLVKKNAPY